MTPLPEKLKAQNTGADFFARLSVNTLIDHLTDYEAEQDRRYKELDNRIQTIANNQLEMSRDDDDDIDWEERDAEHRRRKGAPEQPKRWRAKLSEEYFYVTSAGYVQRTLECHHRDDEGHYLIGNYHQTHEAAEAYKARLLELGKEI